MGGLLQAAALGNAAEDAGAQSAEFFLHPDVSPIQMVDAVHDRLALRGESGQDERRGGPEIARHDRRSRQASRALHDRPASLQADSRAHAHELGHVLESILEDRLCDRGDPVHASRQGHPLRLQVRGIAGVWRRGEVLGGEGGIAVHTNPVLARLDPDAARLEPRGQGPQVPGPAVADGDVPLRQRGSDRIGSRFDAIGHDVVLGRVKRLDTIDLDRLGPFSRDARAHGPEQPSQIHDLRLAGGIAKPRRAFGEDRGEHRVFGPGNGDPFEQDFRAGQPGGARLHVPVFESDLRAQSFKRGQMQVDRPHADRAAARQRDARFAESRQQRPQRQH